MKISLIILTVLFMISILLTPILFLVTAMGGDNGGGGAIIGFLASLALAHVPAGIITLIALWIKRSWRYLLIYPAAVIVIALMLGKMLRFI